MLVFFLPQWWQICVTCFLSLSVVNICPVYLCINEKYIYGFQIVVEEAQQWLSFQSLGMCWFYCGHWFRSTSLLSCRAMVLTRLWVISVWFLFFFHFCLLAFIFVLFRGNEDGWWLCFGSVILFENLESDFLDWRYGFFSSGVVLLDAYLDQTWLILSWCCLKELGV